MKPFPLTLEERQTLVAGLRHVLVLTDIHTDREPVLEKRRAIHGLISRLTPSAAELTGPPAEPRPRTREARP
jgi:hypothetical protein